MGYPGVGGGEAGEDVDGVAALFVGGGEVGAEREEVAGAGAGAPAAADLLLELDHADVAFGEVVVERDAEVVGEAEDLVAVAVEAGEEVAS